VVLKFMFLTNRTETNEEKEKEEKVSFGEGREGGELDELRLASLCCEFRKER